MHFVFAADEAFRLQLLAAVCSLLKACNNATEIVFVHILDCGISNATWKAVNLKMCDFASKFSVTAKVSRHIISTSRFDKLQLWNSSKATYARLLIPTYLPDVRHCIYSDCDMLFINNPYVLVHQLKEKGVAILGHRNPVDRQGRNVDEQWFITHNVPYNKNNYFCAGLIAMDLDKFRAPGAIQSILEFLEKHTDTVSADQTALNWYFRDDCALATEGWGVFPCECFCNHAIFAIHYSGGTPWKGMKSWYDFVMQQRQTRIWRTFVTKFLDERIASTAFEPLTVKLSGMVASLVTRLLLLLHIYPPAFKDYLIEASNVFFNHKNIDFAAKQLLS